MIHPVGDIVQAAQVLIQDINPLLEGLQHPTLGRWSVYHTSFSNSFTADFTHLHFVFLFHSGCQFKINWSYCVCCLWSAREQGSCPCWVFFIALVEVLPSVLNAASNLEVLHLLRSLNCVVQ